MSKKKYNTPIERVFSRVYTAYKGSAKYTDKDFLLSREELYGLIESNCFYCGCLPSNTMVDTVSNEEIRYNGIDRLSSMRGYIKDNCVPCCFVCNRAKSQLSKTQFIDWIKRVYNHMVPNE